MGEKGNAPKRIKRNITLPETKWVKIYKNKTQKNYIYQYNLTLLGRVLPLLCFTIFTHVYNNRTAVIRCRMAGVSSHWRTIACRMCQSAYWKQQRIGYSFNTRFLAKFVSTLGPITVSFKEKNFITHFLLVPRT